MAKKGNKKNAKSEMECASFDKAVCVYEGCHGSRLWRPTQNFWIARWRQCKHSRAKKKKTLNRLKAHLEKYEIKLYSNRTSGFLVYKRLTFIFLLHFAISLYLSSTHIYRPIMCYSDLSETKTKTSKPILSLSAFHRAVEKNAFSL